MLADMFSRIENFFKRLESYKHVSPTSAMTDMIVTIMVEVLSILSIATAEIKQGRQSKHLPSGPAVWLAHILSEKYLKKLLGKSDIEVALKRLDTHTQEEARMAIAEVLKVTHIMDDKMRVLIDGAQNHFPLPCIGYPDHFNDLAITHQMTNKADEEKCAWSRYLFRCSRSQRSIVEQLRRDLRKWLSAPDPSTNHNVARGVHHEGTATWFFQGGIFKEWKLNPSLLWIYGKREFSALCHSAPCQHMSL
jgi:hypothetical protein